MRELRDRKMKPCDSGLSSKVEWGQDLNTGNTGILDPGSNALNYASTQDQGKTQRAKPGQEERNGADTTAWMWRQAVKRRHLTEQVFPG
jgi:hypothetical protein